MTGYPRALILTHSLALLGVIRSSRYNQPSGIEQIKTLAWQVPPEVNDCTIIWLLRDLLAKHPIAPARVIINTDNEFVKC